MTWAHWEFLKNLFGPTLSLNVRILHYLFLQYQSWILHCQQPTWIQSPPSFVLWPMWYPPWCLPHPLILTMAMVASLSLLLSLCPLCWGKKSYCSCIARALLFCWYNRVIGPMDPTQRLTGWLKSFTTSWDSVSFATIKLCSKSVAIVNGLMVANFPLCGFVCYHPESQTRPSSWQNQVFLLRRSAYGHCIWQLPLCWRFQICPYSCELCHSI